MICAKNVGRIVGLNVSNGFKLANLIKTGGKLVLVHSLYENGFLNQKEQKGK